MAKNHRGREPVVRVNDITREEWLEYRRGGIGGSDAATIVGLNPWNSPYSLFCDKMGALPEKEDNEAMRQGRDFEQYVADRWMERTGKVCRRNNTMWRSTRWPWMLADIDREVVGENAGLECKTTSVYAHWDFAAGEINPSYYVQCQHYMAVMGFDRMYLAVLVLNRGFYDFVIERDDTDIAELAAQEGEFWRRIENEDPPPIDGSEPTQKALRALYPEAENDLAIELPCEAGGELERLRQMQDAIKELKAECDAIKNQIMGQMGEAAFAVTPKHTCSWVVRRHKTLDASQLKADHPELYKKYTKTTESRVFSVAKNKEVT